jgi:hypothetical protein
VLAAGIGLGLGELGSGLASVAKAKGLAKGVLGTVRVPTRGWRRTAGRAVYW